ncbi:methyl-accepting chemotaxis protein [Estrella lausannensis]|uniref:Chemotaxis signal transduction protein n=1 Tax=Estrella lausannensis TaxID=483423 RepID=A0A0H5DR61_9BACT|nr:methyl-accepting chemotaxis protein [Estrella lausannensis]CRX38129.1 Chemotaxis signal transduction protein [Estrella lausannensis]
MLTNGSMKTDEETLNPTLIQRALSYLGYAQKIYLIFSIVFIAVLIIGYFLIGAYWEDLQFLKRELAGLRLQQQAEKVLENTVKHKILSYRYHLGDDELKKDLVELQATISKSLSSLIEHTKASENLLSISPEAFQQKQQKEVSPLELQRQWEEFSNTAFEMQPDISEAFHIGFVDNQQELLNFIGEVSNISYDPQAESHHLIQMNLLLLPNIQDLTSQLMIFVFSLSQKQTISITDHNRVIALASLLKDDLNQLKLQYQKAIIAEVSGNRTNEIKNNINTTYVSFSESARIFLSLVDSLLRKEKKGEGEDPLEIYSDLYLAGTKLISKDNQLWESINKQLERLVMKRYDALINKALSILLTTVILVGIAILFSWVVIGELNRYYSGVYTAVSEFRDGNLKVRAPVAYDASFSKITTVLNQLAYTYENLISQLQISGVQLTSSITQLAAASKNQQSTVFKQESTVKEILVTAGEISSTSKQFAKTMNEISDAAEGTSSLAALGKEGLGKMEESMKQMVEASQSIASKLAVLNEKAQEITSVITTITKVADQTNLLALNASIEAEKAGEHGKSFSVIAREIRRLADQTAQATLDIDKMITEMTSAVSEGVMGVDKFSEEITTGVGQVSTVSGQLSRIIEQVQQETASFDSANKRMQALSLGAEQINQSILQLNEVAKQTADSIREFDSAILLIKDATTQMQTYVIKIKS